MNERANKYLTQYKKQPSKPALGIELRSPAIHYSTEREKQKRERI